MKKIFYLASIAALAFSSCAKDQTTEAQIDAVNGGAKITAAMAADDTRTSLEKVDGKYEFRWSAGDQLGVYGVGANTLNNAAFVLNNDSDGKAVGVFSSQSTELKADKDYVAVYPRFQTSLFLNSDLEEVELDVPGTDGEEQADYIDLTKVKVTIPATQKYQNGTFYTQTVPAVSSEFYVSDNGSASLSMQPVVDYLFVNIKSTEPIKTLKLELNDNNKGQKLNLAGTANLTRYEVNGAYRYYVNQKNLTGSSKAIVLETDESYATVTCHDANTYVFAIPGGILGMGGDIEALLTVNDDKAITFKAVGDRTPDIKNIESNKGLNFGGAKFDVVRKKDGEAVKPYENTIFWMNSISVDTDGDKKADARGAFVYNPNGDAIISNEVELLEYIHNYNAGTKVDAFLCEEGSYDFSLKNMMELATEYKNTKYEPYIAAYLADVENGGGFPCFNNYTNNFIGNGAVIENIEQPLLSWTGIFGGSSSYLHYYISDITPVTRGGEFVETTNGGKSITNVTFANIVAKSDVFETDDYVLSDDIIVEYTAKGHILAGSFGGDIKNVIVKDAYGESIMGDMTVAQFSGMTIEGVSDLHHIASNLVAGASLDLTETWSEVSGVMETVFDEITPDKNAKGKDALHVITIPEGDGATYALLTNGVDVTTASAVAVVINDVSYWTGDKFATSTDLDTNCVDKNTTGDVLYFYVKYAEELANGISGFQNGKDRGATLTRDMDMNFANLVRYNSNGSINHDASKYWKSATVQHLDGADHTIKGIAWRNVYTKESGKNRKMSAVFNGISSLKNLTIDGVNVNLVTGAAGSLPEGISVIAPTLADVADVTLKNVVINGSRADGTGNTQPNYPTDCSVKIGYIANNAINANYKNVKVEGVTSNITGIYGVAAYSTLSDYSTTGSSRFENVSIENLDIPAADLTKFAQYNPAKANYNVAGTVVGLVVNNAGRKADIKFINSGNPVFLYDAPVGAPINVIYNNISKLSLENAPAN